MPMDIQIKKIKTNSYYSPEAPRRRNVRELYPHIWAIGNLEILDKRLVGFFCSVKCPGEVILRVYDLARNLRDAGVVVIGGFHYPLEKDCLDLLMRGTKPIVICPARSIENMRIPSAWKKRLTQGRLLILSPKADHLKGDRAGYATDTHRYESENEADIRLITAYWDPQKRGNVGEAL